MFQNGGWDDADYGDYDDAYDDVGDATESDYVGDEDA
jgi:hypothetical protein